MDKAINHDHHQGVIMKLCKKCGLTKDKTEFTKLKKSKDGLSFSCKTCESHYRKNRYKDPDIKMAKKIKNNKWKEENKERIKITTKEWSLKNKEKLQQYRKEYYSVIKDKQKEYYKIYDQVNKEKINLRKKIKRHNNFKIKVNHSIGRTICQALNGKKAGRSWQNLVGYPIKDLINHLESKFTKGMSWENYGKDGWEIDHIIPKYYFNYNDAESKAFEACWALSNLQPLWKTTQIAVFYGEDSSYLGNCEKGNRIKITPEIQKILDNAHS